MKKSNIQEPPKTGCIQKIIDFIVIIAAAISALIFGT